MNDFESRMARIRGRILAILAVSDKALTEGEIIDIYLDAWEEDEELIHHALLDLISKKYINTKITYGVLHCWLSPKGKELVSKALED
jgi:hypothetical protein